MNKPLPSASIEDQLLALALRDTVAAKAVANLPADWFPETYYGLVVCLGKEAKRDCLLSRPAFNLHLEAIGFTGKEIAAENAIRNRLELTAPNVKRNELPILLDTFRASQARKAEIAAFQRFEKERQLAPAEARQKLAKALSSLSEAKEPLRIWGMGELLADDAITQHDALIDGLLRRGEIMNLVAAPKARKSWLVLELATCLEHGQIWLGTYQCTKAKVLLIDNELRLPTLKHRAGAICEAKGITGGNGVMMLPVRGLKFDLADIPAYIERTGAEVIILDALYRFFPEGFDENSNADMTRLYNSLDAIATKTGCAIIVVHHSSKGIQASKSTTDVGSGAGAQSRAADAHVVLRPVKADGDSSQETRAFVDAAGRSFPPQPRIGLEWQFPLWKNVDVAKVDQSTSVEYFANQYFTTDWESSTVVRERAEKAGVSKTKWEYMRKEALAQRLIEASEPGHRNKRDYRRVPTPEDEAKAF